MIGPISLGGSGISRGYPYRVSFGAFRRSADQASAVQYAQRSPAATQAAAGALSQSGMAMSPQASVGTGIPFLREGVDPVAMAVRSRIRYLDQEQSPAAEEMKSAQDVMKEGECQTCASRKYQDGSDDPGVSFKTPTKLSPDEAATAVRGHELEHVVREQAKAAREDREVIQQSVTLHNDICPECGKVYVSGGVTRTVTKSDNQDEQKAQQRRAPFEAVA